MADIADASGSRPGDAERTILCIGLGCIDDVMTVSSYPAEDSTTRVLSRRRARGGNASNNCTVLALLGARCEFLGKIGARDAADTEFVLSDLDHFGIGRERVVRCTEHPMPWTVAIVSAATGTRTLLHHRGGLSELSYDEFRAAGLDLASYGWVHIEARYNEADTVRELLAIDEHNAAAASGRRVRTSVELEKPRRELLALVGAADYVFVSKELARMLGYADMAATVRGLSPSLRPGAVVICGWGECGAAALESGATDCVMCPAFAPERVIDTLGAGDTFTAATVLALSRGEPLQAAIAFGCRVAGTKCGSSGFDAVAAMRPPVASICGTGAEGGGGEA